MNNTDLKSYTKYESRILNMPKWWNHSKSVKAQFPCQLLPHSEATRCVSHGKTPDPWCLKSNLEMRGNKPLSSRFIPADGVKSKLLTRLSRSHDIVSNGGEIGVSSIVMETLGAATSWFYAISARGVEAPPSSPLEQRSFTSLFFSLSNKHLSFLNMLGDLRSASLQPLSIYICVSLCEPSSYQSIRPSINPSSCDI